MRVWFFTVLTMAILAAGCSSVSGSLPGASFAYRSTGSPRVVSTAGKTAQLPASIISKLESSIKRYPGMPRAKPNFGMWYCGACWGDLPYSMCDPASGFDVDPVDCFDPFPPGAPFLGYPGGGGGGGWGYCFEGFLVKNPCPATPTCPAGYTGNPMVTLCTYSGCPQGSYFVVKLTQCFFNGTKPESTASPVPPNLILSDSVTHDELNGKSVTWSIGELHQLDVRSSDGSVLAGCQWSIWNNNDPLDYITNVAVRDYEPTDASPGLVPLVPFGTSLNFYFTISHNMPQVTGTLGVQCSDGLNWTPAAGFTYSLKAPTAAVVINRGRIAVTNDFWPLPNQWSLHFGNALPGTSGMNWAYTVVNPPKTGLIGVFQIVMYSNRTRDGVLSHIQLLADGHIPVYNLTSQTNSWTASDSPGMSLANLSTAEADDEFTDYFMYQPTGGVWVPLEQLTWEWQGSAGSAGGWHLKTSSSTIGNGVQPYFNELGYGPEPNIWSGATQSQVNANGADQAWTMLR